VNIILRGGGERFTVLNCSVNARLTRQSGKIRVGGNCCADTGSLVMLKRNSGRGLNVRCASRVKFLNPYVWVLV
jgi:hypothetical protein